MSIEIYVLSDRRLGAMIEWQQAISAESFPLQLDASRRFDTLRGYLPAAFDGQEAGFECDHASLGDVKDGFDDVDFGRDWQHALAFRFGGDFREGVSAYAAAAAYAKATDGVLFDGDAGEVMSPDLALQMVRAMVRDLPANERWAEVMVGKV